ncbi:MAG TPA: response regulator transcription factor [Draconibacterium sp.]|nr:response regulator transcription factor [Draconibacterium sp.]
MKIRIVVADDHQLFREGLVNLLENDDAIEVIGEAKNGNEAIEKVYELKPDILLTDIAMPEMNGMEATRQLKKKHPELKIVALSMHSDKQFVKGMLEAGTDAYLLKNCTHQQLLEAVHSVYNGKKYLSEDITELVISGYLDGPNASDDNYAELSEREKEIFILLAEGVSTREIGDKLFISVKTVGTHKQNILEKLGLKNNSDIVKYALKKGLIQL